MCFSAGRVLNVAVCPADTNEPPRVLNYLTAPHVYVWSAVACSSAFPLLFEPQELYARDHRGNRVKCAPVLALGGLCRESVSWRMRLHRRADALASPSRQLRDVWAPCGKLMDLLDGEHAQRQGSEAVVGCLRGASSASCHSSMRGTFE